MSTTTTPRFTPQSTLGEVVASCPALARVFERFGLDYCCGGRRSLSVACEAKGLDPLAVAVALEAEGGAGRRESADIDPLSLTLAELADHIEKTHHAFMKAELPRLIEMAGRVARKHGGRDARLQEVATIVAALADEMLNHMQKEELILFPIIRQLEAGPPNGFHCGSIANPIRQMEVEHESAGGALVRLRALTDGFKPDGEACNTHRVLLAGLAEVEADLHRHVHKENNVLFPRAVRIESVRRAF
jgi:regulator of cell morphogenesis and NO signaling